MAFQVEEAASNWNSASTGIGKNIYSRKQSLTSHYIGLKRPPFGLPLP